MAGVPPGHIRIHLIISSPALVLVPKPLLRRLLPLTVNLHDALGALFHIRMDKSGQAVRLLPQDIVGAAADDNARSFLRQLQDDLPLEQPQLVLGGQAVGKPSR